MRGAANTVIFLIAIVCLAFGPSAGFSQDTDWDKFMVAGVEAQQRGEYAEAEKMFVAALEVAGSFGDQDPRLATSLNNLAGLYRAQGKYAEAEPLYQRALAIREQALGPEHPAMIATLENYAAALRAMGRDLEAGRIENRARKIRAGLAEANQVSVVMGASGSQRRRVGRSQPLDGNAPRFTPLAYTAGAFTRP